VALIAGGLTVVLEILQAPLPTRYADITTALIGMAGAVLGASAYCWAVDSWRASRVRQEGARKDAVAVIAAASNLLPEPEPVGVGVYDD
jgi:hypothetical protein